MKKKLTGDNYPHTKMMTLKEWEQFEENFYNYSEFHKAGGSISEYLTIQSTDSFEGLIQGAFGWNLTPQGAIYWWEIADRTKPVE